MCPTSPTGINHNIPVLRDIITQSKFIAGDINTNFIKEVYPKRFEGQWVGHTAGSASLKFVLFLLIVCCPVRRGMS